MNTETFNKSKFTKVTFNNILPHLKTKVLGRSYKHFDIIDSTNTYCKTLDVNDIKEGTLIISEEQIKGKGTKGRSWVSPKGSGLWFSIILKPKININDIGKITILTSSALYETFKTLGIESKIKWPNDIFINDKKVCGILTEAKLNKDIVEYIILGIGINVNSSFADFDNNLKVSATSLKIELNKEVDRCYVLGTFLNIFETFYNEMLNNESLNYFQIYKKNSYIINKEVNIIKNNTIETVKVLDFDLNGFIIIKDSNGVIRKISSGEISLKI